MIDIRPGLSVQCCFDSKSTPPTPRNEQEIYNQVFELSLEHPLLDGLLMSGSDISFSFTGFVNICKILSICLLKYFAPE